LWRAAHVRDAPPFVRDRVVLADYRQGGLVRVILTGPTDATNKRTTTTIDLTGGPVDLDALVAYLGARPGIAPAPADRITVLA
jgi:hypothetical protein